MSDRQQDTKIRSTTSFRLAIGFGTILVIFAFALLVNIYNLEKLKTASEAVRVRQQIRGRTLKVVQAGTRMTERLTSGKEIASERLQRLKDTCAHMTHTLQAVATPHVDPLEWTNLNHLTLSALHLHDVLNRASTTQDEAEIARMQELAKTLADRMVKLDDRIGTHFDAKTYDLEAQAEWSWKVSRLVTRSILGIAVAVSLLVVYLTHRAIVGPIRTLLQGTLRLSRGQLTSRINVPPTGEFRALAQSFNRMAEALESHQKQLVEAEKLATIGRFSAGTAHEINNPITVILGYAKTIKRRLPEGSADREALEAIEEEARHCKNIVQELLDISRPPADEGGEEINPHDIITEVKNVARVLKLTQKVDTRIDVPNCLVKLPTPRSRLRQIILNLVTNALEALQETEEPYLLLEGYVRDQPESSDGRILRQIETGASYLVLRFADNGPGIPPDELDRLFEPFFTTKPRGTGLGLTIAYSLVDRHGGYIDATSNVGEGTVFAVNIPIEEDDEGSSAQSHGR